MVAMFHFFHFQVLYLWDKLSAVKELRNKQREAEVRGEGRGEVSGEMTGEAKWERIFNLHAPSESARPSCCCRRSEVPPPPRAQEWVRVNESHSSSWWWRLEAPRARINNSQSSSWRSWRTRNTLAFNGPAVPPILILEYEKVTKSPGFGRGMRTSFEGTENTSPSALLEDKQKTIKVKGYGGLQLQHDAKTCLFYHSRFCIGKL